MKFEKREGDTFRFIMSASEQRAFVAVLIRYPLVNRSLKEIKLDDKDNEHQQLLDEALEEHRREARQQVLHILEAEGRFTPAKKRVVLTVSRTELDILVAALNDVRVGAWMQLGSPDPARVAWHQMIGPQAEHGFLMEAAGLFQSQMLAGLRASL